MKGTKDFLFSIFKDRRLILALSERKDGSMKLIGNPKVDGKVLGNQKKFLKKIGVKMDNLVRANVFHSDSVKIVKADERGKILKADGLITNEKNLFLALTVADCLPIFLFDLENEVVGLIHAGWRGLAKNILKKTVHKLKWEFKSQPEKILVGIGPGISSCHYEAKKEILKKFKSFSKEVFHKKDQKIFLDLKKIAAIQLLNLGFKKENIEISPACTYCLKNKYFSFRRDQPEIIQAMMAVIGLKS